MQGLRKGFSVLLLMAVTSAPSATSARQSDGASDFWLQRARSLTGELVKDSDALERYDRALLLARLGRAWQRDEPGWAREWVEKSIGLIESGPEEESAAEHARRLDAARSLLVILGAHDKTSSARLNKVLNAAAEAAPGGAENAKAKAEAGLAVLDSDPQRAVQFGRASLRAGGSYKLASLLWRLRQRDVKLSDALFAEVLAAARARDYDPDLLAILPTVAFEGPSPSDTLRGSFLGVLAEGLSRAASSAREQSAACRLAPLAAPLLPEFQRLLPQQAGGVRARLAECQAGLDQLAWKEAGDALQERPLNTVEELLEAAGESSDLERRVTYRNRAAYTASRARQYERAVAILDGYNSKERDLANKMEGGLWESRRAEFAGEAAVAHLRRGDRPAMSRIIADTPAHLRISVQISVAAELAKKDAAAATQMLDEARAALAKAGSPQDFDSYLALARLYATLSPQDALPALRDAVRAMNETERVREVGSVAVDAEAPFSLLSNDLLLGRYAVPVSLLAADEIGLGQALASIDAPARRAAMRLNLLTASLARRRAASPKTAAGTKGTDHENR